MLFHGKFPECRHLRCRKFERCGQMLFNSRCYVEMIRFQTYVVQNGHSIVLHESPSLEAVSAEMIDSAVEPEVKTDGWLHNRHGVWVRLPDHQHKFALAQVIYSLCSAKL